MVGLRRRLLNTVHALLGRNGRKEKRERLTSEKGLAAVLEKYSWTAAEAVELAVIKRQIAGLNEGIKQLEAAISETGEQLQGFDNLVWIKGIGKRSAAILLSIIGKIEDFHSEGRLASYVAIVPRVRNSNETVHHGRIRKQGSRMERTTLVQCT